MYNIDNGTFQTYRQQNMLLVTCCSGWLWLLVDLQLEVTKSHMYVYKHVKGGWSALPIVRENWMAD